MEGERKGEVGDKEEKEEEEELGGAEEGEEDLVEDTEGEKGEE